MTQPGSRTYLRTGARLRVTFGFIGAFLFTANQRIQGQDANSELTHATSLVRAGRYDAAIAELERAIRRNPPDPRLRTVEGLAYSLKGDNAEALTALDAALHITPGFPAALKAEAEILTRERRPKAITVLLQVLKADPGDTVAREMLALEQARSGDCAAAIPNFAVLAPGLDRHPNSVAQYGGCLFSVGKFAEASATFSRAAQVQPANADLLYDLALSQVNAGENKAAVATLTPLLNGDADLDTLTLASEAEEAIGDTPQSVALMRRAIVRDPTLADSYVRFAELCMLHESYQAGVEMVSAGIARLPQSSSLYLARGMLYGGEGEYSRSEADFHTAELFDPKHGTGAFGVGLVQAQNHHPEEALTTARAALREHPNDARLNFLVARLLIERGEQPGSSGGFGEAFTDAEKSVQLLPDFVAARNLLAKIYMSAGKVQQAIEQCRAVLKVEPNDETATYRLLLAARQVGDTATVQELSKRVFEQHQRARSNDTNRLRFRIVGSNSSGELPKGDSSKPSQ